MSLYEIGQVMIICDTNRGLNFVDGEKWQTGYKNWCRCKQRIHMIH